jgi:hypothetical protein
VFVASRAAAVTLEGNTNAMSINYEDNFGFYCTDDDPDELAFFRYTRGQLANNNVTLEIIRAKVEANKAKAIINI